MRFSVKLAIELRNHKFNDNRNREDNKHEAEHSSEADCRIHKIVARLFVDVLAGISYVFHGKPPDTFDTSSIPNIAFCCKVFLDRSGDKFATSYNHTERLLPTMCYNGWNGCSHPIDAV
jgi:hypothetical protein